MFSAVSMTMSSTLVPTKSAAAVSTRAVIPPADIHASCVVALPLSLLGGLPSLCRCECCILTGVDGPFDFQVLRIQQPGRLLPNRASYEIFNEEQELLAIATETEAHTRLKLLSK